MRTVSHEPRVRNKREPGLMPRSLSLHIIKEIIKSAAEHSCLMPTSITGNAGMEVIYEHTYVAIIELGW